MMTKREAQRVAKLVAREPLTFVTGYRRWGRGQWEIDAVDLQTGYPFVVSSVEQWQDMRVEANLIR